MLIESTNRAEPIGLATSSRKRHFHLGVRLGLLQKLNCLCTDDFVAVQKYHEVSARNDSIKAGHVSLGIDFVNLSAIDVHADRLDPRSIRQMRSRGCLNANSEPWIWSGDPISHVSPFANNNEFSRATDIDVNGANRFSVIASEEQR